MPLLHQVLQFVLMEGVVEGGEEEFLLIWRMFEFGFLDDSSFDLRSASSLLLISAM